MDKLEEYRTVIKQLLSRHAELISRRPRPDMETELSFDEEHDHYMLLKIGWSPRGRINSTTIHVRLRNGKFWIETDLTENGIATDLLAAGVPKDDIVLAFQPPEMRQYTEFAVA